MDLMENKKNEDIDISAIDTRTYWYEYWVGDPIEYPDTAPFVYNPIKIESLEELIQKVEEQNEKIDELIELIKKYLTQKEE